MRYNGSAPSLTGWVCRSQASVGWLIVRRAPLGDIKEAAIANGMKEMRTDGLQKVLEGITTPEEVRRVVFTAGF